MKSLLILAALSLAAPAARAVDVELSIGTAKYNVVGNGYWYQEGFPYKLDLTDKAFQLGVAGKVTNWLDWRASYIYLGQANSDAMATPDDRNYDFQNHRCVGECIAMSRFRGTGKVQGIALTLEPHVEYKGWRLGVMGGPFIYTATWHMDVSNWIPAAGYIPKDIHVDHKTKINLGAVVGVSIGRGPVSIQYQRFFDRPSFNEPAGDFPPLWRHTDMISVTYRW